MYRIIGYNEPTDKAGFIVLDPRVNRHISSGKLTLKESNIDDLTITVNQASPLWDNVRPYHTHVNVYDDNELIFRGRAIKPKKSMEESGQFIREYVFEDIEAYLMDSTQRFYEGVGQTPKEFLQTLIDVHNSQVPDYKKFQLRNVNVTNNKDDQYRQIDYPKTSDAINDKLVKSLGGYIVTTYNPNGINYLDYLTDIGVDHKDDTPIQLAKNMKSASMQIDPTKVITRLIPLGKTLEPEKIEVSGNGDGSFGDGATEPVNGDWTPVMQYAAKLVGEHLSDDDIANLKNRIRIESGGDENIANNWDSNAAAGTPSKGLMQFVEKTFRYYAREPFTTWVGQGSGLCQLVATMNIPNWRQQIAGSGGWSPHGAPISKEPIKVVDTSSWGWPFPDVGEGHFSQVQSFGNDGGYRQNSFHDGVDFGSVDHPGRDVHCIHGGTVIIKSSMAGLGNFVVTHSPDGFNIVYQEAFSSSSNIIVNVGQKVKTGDVIGYRDLSHVHIGVTKQDFYQAVRNSFSPAGGWMDPVKLIKEGGDGSKPQSGTQTVDNSNAARPKLTIADVNNGRDYIDIPDLQKEFGIIEGTLELDNVDDPNVLMQQAKAWIDTQRIPQSWEVSALELHMPNFNSFKVADRYMFINPNVAKTQLLRITQKEIDLLKPHASTLTIGDKSLGITDYQLENSRNQQEFLNFKVSVNNRFTKIGSTVSQSQSSGQITDNANTKNVAQLQFDMKQLHKVVDDDLPAKYVSVESFNKLKEQVEKLTTGGDDSGK